MLWLSVRLIVAPRSTLTDELRALIRQRETDILRELATEAGESRQSILCARDVAAKSHTTATLDLGAEHAHRLGWPRRVAEYPVS